MSSFEWIVSFLLMTPTLLAAFAIATSALSEFQRGRKIRRLLRIFDEGLSVLGRNSMEAIYDHLKIQYALARDDIPMRLGLFHTGLVGVLGSKGAILVEKQIAKCMCSRLKLKYEEGSPWDFSLYFRAAVQKLKI